MNWLSASATTRMMALFRSDPFAIRQMIGSSRAGLSPVTYRGVTAASSMTTAIALVLVTLVSFAIMATSSSSAAKPPAMGLLQRFGSHTKVAPQTITALGRQLH